MTALLTRLLGRLPIGWMQLMHNRTRLLAAVGGVTFANVLIFMQMGFMNAALETSVFTHQSFEADVVLVGSDFRSLRESTPLPLSRMHQALAVPGVVDGTPVYVGTTTWTNTLNGDTTSFRVIGVDPDATAFRSGSLNEKVRTLREPHSALLDSQTRDLSPKIRDAVAETGRFDIEMGGRRIVFTSLFSEGASFETDGSLIVSDQTFFTLFPNRSRSTPTLVLLQSESGTDPKHVAASIELSTPEPDMKAFAKEDWVAAEREYQQTQKPLGFVFGFGVVIGLIVGLVIVYQVLATDVQDHLSEYATFKAIGYPPRFFMGIVFEEAVSLATLGFIPGLGLALILYRVASAATALPITMPWTRPVLVLFLTIVMCTASGAIATRRLNSADPADLF